MSRKTKVAEDVLKVVKSRQPYNNLLICLSNQFLKYLFWDKLLVLLNKYYVKKGYRRSQT